jgi:aspartate aminotransferase
MSEPATVTMSATLAADEALARRRRGGERVLSLAGGEIGLPVPPALRAALADAAGRNAYGPVAGDPELRAAAAGYWDRRGLPTDPDLVVCGPGSKPLLFATLLAVGGDTVVPTPGWVSYVQQARLAGGRAIPVPTPPGQGGVPDPERLREAVARARSLGRDPRTVVVTVPDNPTGTVADPGTVGRLAEAARELDLVIVSDEIYRDLVFDPSRRPSSPARFAPERTIVTTGVAKHLALGGWRMGVARLPEGPRGEALRDRLVAIASQIWSSTAAPVQAASVLAFGEPPEITAHVAACLRLHEATVHAVARRFTDAGAALAPVTATCYLYPDFAPLRERLARKGVDGSAALADRFARRHGVGLLAGGLFGEPPTGLRVRAATGRLYGETDTERAAALSDADPLRLPWIRRSLDHLEQALADLAR